MSVARSIATDLPTTRTWFAELRLWHSGLAVQPGNFSGWSPGACFYPMLYVLTRVGEATDWGSGLPLREEMFGKMSQLEVHHIWGDGKRRTKT